MTAHDKQTQPFCIKDDPLYRQAIEIVAAEQKASPSFIQYRLQIGYVRACLIIEQMEIDGLISAADQFGRRDVIMGGAHGAPQATAGGSHV